MPDAFAMDDATMELRLKMVQSYVAKPFPGADQEPALVGDGLFVGNKCHATDVENLLKLGVTGVLNCAPTGISTLPLKAYNTHGILYKSTNVAQDNHTYPILHRKDGSRSEHLETAFSFYQQVRQTRGKVLFFCVAGQNRSAALAVAALVLSGQSLESVLATCSERRPFILENVGFQRQLVELEDAEQKHRGGKRSPQNTVESPSKRPCVDPSLLADQRVEVELHIPGLCTFDVEIPVTASIITVREHLERQANAHLDAEGREVKVGKWWLVFTMFGFGAAFDIVLEEAAVEVSVQLERLQESFGLEVVTDCDTAESLVRWDARCRFEMVIFSLTKTSTGSQDPFVFRHQERPGAPGTLLAQNLMNTHMRAWDFASGEAFRSTTPMVFSYSDDPRSKRDFMNVSTSAASQRQQFKEPGEGGILGMGNNAIVHRVQLQAAAKTPELDEPSDALQLPPRLARNMSTVSTADHVSNEVGCWDAAVKRPFSLAKMLASMGHKAEAGVAKRLRMAGALNKHGRLLYFHGLGIALASNNSNYEEYKFEAVLLSRYQEEFSSYTLKRFMDDYIADTSSRSLEKEERARLISLHSQFTLIKVKVLLVSLLNGFRDLTLMGVQAFDFNHLNNVLISRDYRKARLIDIDGGSKGSIQFPSEYIEGRPHEDLHKPALDVDLSTLLPLVLQELIFGKGRGKAFVTTQISKVRSASSKSDEDAKGIIKAVIRENFFPELASQSPETDSAAHKHLMKVVEWFYALLMKKSPWNSWTNDIYDAMRCIDHLPIA